MRTELTDEEVKKLVLKITEAQTHTITAMTLCNYFLTYRKHHPDILRVLEDMVKNRILEKNKVSPFPYSYIITSK